MCEECDFLAIWDGEDLRGTSYVLRITVGNADAFSHVESWGYASSLLHPADENRQKRRILWRKKREGMTKHGHVRRIYILFESLN